MRKVECRKFEYIVDERRIRTEVESKVTGTFLGWGNEYEEFDGGPGNYTVAIVEMPDGKVDTFMPRHVRFLPESTTHYDDHLHFACPGQYDTTPTAPPGKTVCGA